MSSQRRVECAELSPTFSPLWSNQLLVVLQPPKPPYHHRQELASVGVACEVVSGISPDDQVAPVHDGDEAHDCPVQLGQLIMCLAVFLLPTNEADDAAHDIGKDPGVEKSLSAGPHMWAPPNRLVFLESLREINVARVKMWVDKAVSRDETVRAPDGLHPEALTREERGWALSDRVRAVVGQPTQPRCSLSVALQ